MFDEKYKLCNSTLYILGTFCHFLSLMSNHSFSTPFFHDYVFNVLEIMHVIK